VTILVAGIGNVFLGDDGFGVEVARVADYGIRGMHLAYDLAGANHELTIMVDATQRGDPPGTVYVIELDTTSGSTASPVLDAHGMQPDAVLNLVGMLGANPGRVLLVGCEPAVLDQRMGLSPAVERAVDTAVRVVTDLCAREEPACASAFPEK
jgi:hydrogenase maturation protease